MEIKSIVVALILLAVLFGWYAWLESGERRRARREKKRSSFNGADADGELWKDE